MPFERYRPHSLYPLPACLCSNCPCIFCTCSLAFNSPHRSGPPETASEARRGNVLQRACCVLASLSPRHPPSCAREHESLPAPSHPRYSLIAAVPVLHPGRTHCLQDCLLQEDSALSCQGCHSYLSLPHSVPVTWHYTQEIPVRVG